ncbi:MAG: TIGR03986 family CRISPR-associated RAMP protein, partial [Roseiflexus sp.]|nr:TIGR03986 family CRISPR-associated RAMP protein [Roseiflexus sp.]
MAKHKGKPNNQNRQRQKEAAQKFRLPEVAKSGHTREHQRQEAVSKQAQAVKAQKTLKIPWPAPRQPTEMREEYRFLNPYNF